MNYLFFQIVVGVICLILGTAVFFIIKKSTKLRGNLENVVLLVIAFPFGYLFYWVTNDSVSIICEVSSPMESKEYVSFSKSIVYRDNQDNAKYFDVELGNIYVVNSSSEDAIFYPVGYGNISVDDNDVVLIEAHSISCIPKHIDYYFHEPESISIDEKKSGEIRYVLNWFNDTLKE